MRLSVMPLVCCAALWISTGLTAANAQTPAPRPLPPIDQQALEQRLSQMQAEIDQLRAAQAQAVDLTDAAKSRPANEVIVTPSPDRAAEKPKVVYPTATIGGFFQADAGWFSQDPVSELTLGDIQNGADFRRARLNAHGNVWDNVSYILEVDFAQPGRPSFADLAFDIKETPLLHNVKVGYFRQPFGLDALTSVRELTFLERALPFAFVPFRRIGAMAYDQYGLDDNGTWAYAISRAGTDQWGGDFGDSDGWAFTSRLTYVPLYNHDFTRLVHVGASYHFAAPSSQEIRYAQGPEVFIGDAPVVTNVPFFVDTGFIPAQHTNVAGVETLVLYGPVHVEGEYMVAAVDQLGGPNVAFTGGYGQAGLFLLGPNRPYHKASGTLGALGKEYFQTRDGTHPIAIELTGRISYLDLNDNNIAGGTLRNLTAGLNVYLNPFTKFQFNYINGRLNNAVFGQSNTDIFAVRAQVGF